MARITYTYEEINLLYLIIGQIQNSFTESKQNIPRLVEIVNEEYHFFIDPLTPGSDTISALRKLADLTQAIGDDPASDLLRVELQAFHVLFGYSFAEWLQKLVGSIVGGHPRPLLPQRALAQPRLAAVFIALEQHLDQMLPALRVLRQRVNTAAMEAKVRYSAGIGGGDDPEFYRHILLRLRKLYKAAVVTEDTESEGAKKLLSLAKKIAALMD